MRPAFLPPPPLLLLLLLLTLLLARAAASPHDASEVSGVTVSACLPGEAGAAEALAELAAGAVRAAGGGVARVLPPPPECRAPVPADAAACLGALTAALAAGRLTAALAAAPAAAAPDAWRLRDAGLDRLGDAAPPAARLCFATRPPARSLLDLADPRLASLYALPDEVVVAARARALADADRDGSSDRSAEFSRTALVPERCAAVDATCATVLVGDDAEAGVIFDEVNANGLFARVLPLGARPANVTRALEGHAAVACDWAPDLGDLADLPATALGPPACAPGAACPFESRRIVKLVNARALARSPAALRALVRLRVSAAELHELGQRARRAGPARAALDFLAAHPDRGPRRELRVTVLLPNATRREAYDASALAAAAALAEADLEAAGAGAGRARYKVATFDDRCEAARAYKHLSDALGTGEYGALAAVAGPACGAAFADVARQSTAHALPVLAYTGAAEAGGGALALLGAGAGAARGAALGALLVAARWRRLAVLADAAARPLLAAASLHAELVVHLELDEDPADHDYDVFVQWASRVREANARIVYVCAEDWRATRAALCAGRAAGLLPAAGWLWLLAPPPRALRPAGTDVQPCSHDQLLEVADGHFSVVPAWELAWRPDTEQLAGAGQDAGAGAWLERWRAQCRLFAGVADCARPGPYAALLYDMLRLWFAALDRMLADNAGLVDDLHDPALVRSLVVNATKLNYTGLTGRFEWTALGGESTAFARSSAVALLQWVGGAQRLVGSWRPGAPPPDLAAARWLTADGRVPDDGGDRCALRPLADLLRADCRAAFVALGALLLLVALAALAAAALYCRRRAERDVRARLDALGLRSLPKAVGLDRWEIPRERVVINRKLGMGAFGTVYGGHALLAEDRGWSAVAVKTLKAGASTEEKLDFLSEAEAMKRFDHRNVVRLLGVVTKTEPVCTVMEFMLYGDLKNYLLARRHLAGAASTAGAEGEAEAEAEGAEEQVSARRLTAMALDAARALAYLARLRYVHRDVAARNCLVSARRVVKLADFGMTRLVFENDYYRFSRKGMLPVRWMAPESLALGVFSPASDVWSFGVLLYEIVTFGSLPFQGLSNAEVLARVKGGGTIELPVGLKPQLESLILSCWQRDGRARPAAAALAAALADCPRLLAPCLDVPLDALPLDAEPPWRLPRDQAEARWVSWAAPASAATDTTYLSTEPREHDRFLPDA